MPPIRIAHLVNPFRPGPGSEFHYVQPITCATMLAAQAATAPDVEVTLLGSIVPGDAEIFPLGFIRTPDLDRTVRDCVDFEAPPLPLIADLLQRLYDASTADYLIYTNVDIALQPHFYNEVARLLRQGHDALIINRRRIPGHYRHLHELPLMYAEQGKSHPGFDCFVFHRDLFPKFHLGQVCIGIPFIEILTSQNIFAHARNFKLVDDAHWTFHIGEEVFKPRHPGLWKHNRNEFWKAVDLLWPHLDSRKFPWGNKNLLYRLIRWGLHPCIPIRLALKLEWARMNT